jgi:hypothetical protein
LQPSADALCFPVPVQDDNNKQLWSDIMIRLLTAFAACGALCLGVAFAGEHAEKDAKPSFQASQMTEITATVATINHETREVTLRDEDGNEVSFVAGDVARNLDQVQVGDIVTAAYEERISVQVFENDGMEPDSAELAAMARAEKGEMPGGAVVDTKIVTAVVEDINIEANTFKLRGPQGEVKEFTARNPENLKRAEVGDLVVMTVTDAVAISVERGPEQEDAE